MQCPSCHSEKVIKNGRIHNQTPKFACKACGRQFIENPQHRLSEDKKALIDKRLLESIRRAGIARVVGI